VVSTPGARLLSHRPESRAVVRIGGDDAAESRFVKIVAPQRVERLVAPLRLLAGSELAFRVPTLLESRAAEGHVVLASIPGQSLHDLLAEPARFVAGAAAAGEALRSLHRLSAPGLRQHHAGRVVEELERRVRFLDAFHPPLAGRIGALLGAVAEALERDGRGPLVPVHRDFHDKQVVLDGDGGVGVLDFETLSLGEAAMDVANALAHFELRALQGLCSTATAAAAAGAILDAYHPSAATGRRLGPHLDATRLRLATLYALRPMWTDVPDLLLARVGLGGPHALAMD
jgi:Ser/Thr protein kinase RdoA (MazF antagonist)